MSVILDALQKARTDRRKKQDESHANSVARVLDPGVTPAPGIVMPQAKNRTWIVVVALIFAGLCLLALIGGAFFLLYDQIRKLNAPAVRETPPATSVPAAAVMPTPVPLSELPVQTPAPQVAPVAVVAPAGNLPVDAPAPGAAPAFKLGSIVCEGDDCIANLNNRSVKVGDRVKNYQVTEITPSSVTLQGSNPADTVTLSHYD